MNFLNKKNSLSLKQLFVLHGNSPDFLYAPPLNAGSPTFSIGGLKCALLFEVDGFVDANCIYSESKNISSSLHFIPFRMTKENESQKTSTATSEAMLRHRVASLFCREAEVLYGALKTKSCLSEASSFCLAEKSTGVGKKVQP